MEDNRYCFGCGSILQSSDESKDGYIDEKILLRNDKDVLCKRCYRLKNYGEFKVADSTCKAQELIKKAIEKDDFIFLMVDVGLVYAPISKKLEFLNDYQNIYVLVNRYDIYKEIINKEKTIYFIKKQLIKNKIKYSDVIIIDNNYLDIYSLMKKTTNNFIVGLENAGKSTFINNLLRNVFREKNKSLLNSKYPGTTLNLIKIQIAEDKYLLDSPGIINTGSFLNKLKPSLIKQLDVDKKINTIIFQLNSNQSIIVNNFLRIDYVLGCKTSLVIHLPHKYEYIRCKLANADKTFNSNIRYLKIKDSKIKSIEQLNKYEIMIKNDSKYDIVIDGFAFISVNKKGKYIIHTYKNVNIYVRQALI